MSSTTALDENAIDDILYLARANEVDDLSAYLSELAASSQRPKPELVALAVDGYSKNTALHYAAANGHVDTIRLLFSLETDKASALASGLINAANNAGNTALHWAALNGHLECVKLLVQAGADVTVTNAGHDAVFEAEINDKGDVVDWLLGAVEELENGIGQAGGEGGASSSSTSAHDLGADVQDETSRVAGADHGQSAAAAVDDVTGRMDRLETKDAPKNG